MCGLAVATTDARDLDVSGGYLYIADGAGGLRSFTLASPAAPVELDVFKTDTTHTIGTAVELSLAGDHAFVLDSSGGSIVHAVDTSTPSSLTWVDDYTDASYTFEDISASEISGSLKFVYITTGNGDYLLEICLSGSTFYFYRSYTDPDYFPRKVTTSGTYVYLIGKRNVDVEPPDENALIVLSKYPSSLAKVGQSNEISGYAADVRVIGGRAYVVDNIGFHIYDVGDPTDPGIIDYLNTPGSPTGVDASGAYAFIASGILLFQTVDLTLPTSLTEVATYDSGGSGAWGVAVRGDYAYASASSGLQIFDVSDPDNPFWVGLHDSAGGGMHDVDIRGNTVYTTDGAYFQPNSLKLVDVSDPENPALITKALNFVAPSSHSTMAAHGVSLYGDYAYVTDNFPSGGMYAVNINPASGNFLKDYGSCNTRPAPEGGIARGIAVFGSHAFVADSDGGLSVINVADPTALSDGSLVKNLLFDPNPVDTSAEDVVVSGRYAYVSDSELGLKIISLIP